MLEEEIQKLAMQLNRDIRHFAKEKNLYNYEITERVLGGSIKDSIGPFPEYLMHGVKCARSEAGLCTPCGYSLDGYSLKDSQKIPNIHEKIQMQATNLIRGFDDLIMQRQFRLFEYGQERVYFVLSSVGSFFSDTEVFFDIKEGLFRDLDKTRKRKNLDIYLFTEVRPEDVIDYESNGKLERISGFLRNLNTTIVLGLESIDSVIRNCAYLKNLSLGTFEEAVKILKNHDLKVGAFVFVGAISLAQKEIICDFEKTISYLYSKRIMPVIMVENIKNCTVDHLLFIFGKHRLVEPRTTLKVLQILRRRQVNLDPEPWLVADPVGGPPEPVIHSFRNSKMVTCNDCSGVILNGLRYVRKTYNWVNFDTITKPEVDECNCTQEYAKLLENENEYCVSSLEDRIADSLGFAKRNLKNYFKYLMETKIQSQKELVR